MAVVIYNVSKKYNEIYGEGKQVYELYINQEYLCTFEHNFEDGLATCLRKAADTFELTEKKDE